MIKRTIEISSEPAHLAVRNGQLILKRDGAVVGQVPCEDLALVIIDHPGTTYSHRALASLLESQAVVVVCGGDHLPQGMLLPFGQHSQVVSRLMLQIAAAKPLKKRLWQQIVSAKVRAQADNLHSDCPTRRLLIELARNVKSGDRTNVEAQAARAYWKSWLLSPDSDDGEDVDFRRLRAGEAPNGLLNYGYTVMRAAVARAIVVAGLHPALGLQHSNRSNAFCLADDLIEPLRPIVDACVRDLYFSGETDVDRRTKQALLELLTTTVLTGDQTGPLMVGLSRYTASLVRCLEGTQQRLEIPKRC